MREHFVFELCPNRNFPEFCTLHRKCVASYQKNKTGVFISRKISLQNFFKAANVSG